MDSRKLNIKDIFIRNLLFAILAGLIVAGITGNFHTLVPPPTGIYTKTNFPEITSTLTRSPAPVPTNTYTNTSTATIIPTFTPSLSPTKVLSSKCDNFDNDFLSGWQWIDPRNDSSYSFSDRQDHLRITVNGKNHDLYQNLDAPRMLQYVEGDFSVTTKLNVDPIANYQGAGLLFWQNSNNYIRLERTLVKGIDLLYRINGDYKAVEIPFISTADIYLKLERRDLIVQASYSEDRINWEDFKPITIRPYKNNQIGVDVVNEWQDNQLVADFDFFMFDNCR